MTDAQTLGTPDWLMAPATRAVITALEAARPACARFVGGCVRNTLMGRSVDDIDIATQLLPVDTVTALNAAGIRAIPTGIEHGTVTAICEGQPFEITSLRRDVETDGRRAVVAFTTDWAEDAQRRDFRLNALYAAPDGTLYDPSGGGLADAASGRVIFIGDADQRLREDYLRILRFFRFNAWYGAGVHAEGLAACTRQRAGLSKIAAERIWKELKKLLSAPMPADAMAAMADSGVLAELLGDANAGHLFTLQQVEGAAGLSPDPMQRLMVMIPRRTRDAASLADRLRLSNAEAARLHAWAAPSLPSLLAAKPDAIRAAIYRHGAEAARDRVIAEAATGGAGTPQLALDICIGWTPPKFPLGGKDALAAGLTGQAIGEALRRAEDWWVANGFAPDRAALLARLVQGDE